MATPNDETTLLSLPFEIHVCIVRNLNLSDALCYAEAHQICHDAAFYVFGHRRQLDFTSLLDKNGVICLTDNKIMTVLHAHTRATDIRYLALSPSFRALDELKFYLDLYWQHNIIPCYEDDLPPSFFTGDWVGHPAGHLTSIGYVSTNPRVTELLKRYDDPIYGVCIDSEPCHGKILKDNDNWSTVDIDKPYAKCDICGCTIEPDNNPSFCHTCYSELIVISCTNCCYE